MITYNKYVNGQDHNWYDSSNVIYSKCYDNNEQFKTLKIVFKDGRTYMYKDVDANDYLSFRNATSNGQAVNTYIIKKYKGVRIADTDIEKLSELQENFINDENTTQESCLSNLVYEIEFCEKDGKFLLKLNDRPIYYGVEGQVSIVNLLRSMNIKHTMTPVEEVNITTDETEEKINLD